MAKCGNKTGNNQYGLLNLDIVKNRLEDEGYTLLSFYYKNNRTPLLISCPFNHQYTTTMRVWSNGNRCPECYYLSRFKYKEEDAFLRNYNYKLKVTHFTRLNYIKDKLIINPFNLPRGQYLYHIDHNFSMDEGFNNGILPEIIGNTFNLKMMWWNDNLSKHANSSITLQELYEGYEKYKQLTKEQQT